MLSAHAFSSPLFYYYFPSSKFYICFFPSFPPLFARSFSFFLFFFLSFRLLVCLVCWSVGLSSLILSRSFWPCSPFVLRIIITKSVFFNKPKLFPYPQNSFNTWRNIGNRAFLVRRVICYCVTYKWYAWIEEVKTTVLLTVVKNLAQWSFFYDDETRSIVRYRKIAAMFLQEPSKYRSDSRWFRKHCQREGGNFEEKVGKKTNLQPPFLNYER